MKKIKTYINLLDSANTVKVPIDITYEDKKNKISLIYNKVEYIGVGSEWLLEDAFADLQSKLPKDVKISCCMTCRHGNMCPVGNEPRELYCTKNIKVNNKDELLELFNDDKINQDNKVYFDYYCSDYEKQNSDNYTYNDYLYYLSGKNL